MPKLFFIRSRASFDCWDYYETKTDVMVFGDIDGYRWLCRFLQQAKKARTNIHLSLLDNNACNMRCVILPAISTKRKSPRLKFIERCVWFKNYPKMEMVICGNKSGYQHLIERIKSLNATDSNPTEYVRIDDQIDSALLPRSVSLNVRSPLVRWNSKALGPYRELLTRRSSNRFPQELHYHLKERIEYDEISANKSDFLKI